MASHAPAPVGGPIPYRNTGGSVSDDDAVPDTDPNDVSYSHSESTEKRS